MPLPLGPVTNALKGIGAQAVKHPHLANAAVQSGVGVIGGALTGGAQGALIGGAGGAATGAVSSYVDPRFNQGGAPKTAAFALPQGVPAATSKPRDANQQISVMPMQPQQSPAAPAQVTGGMRPPVGNPAQAQLPAPAGPRMLPAPGSDKQGHVHKEASQMAMSAQEAVLYNSVYLPAFVEKCAARGFEINDAESLNSALDIAALTKQHLAKQANSTVKMAANNLRRSLGLPVVNAEKAASVAQTDLRAKEAGLALSKVPEVRQALLHLASAN